MQLNQNLGLAFAPNGGLAVGDRQRNRVRLVTPLDPPDARAITTLLGDGSAVDSAPAGAFAVDSPAGLAQDSLGNLFVTSRTGFPEAVTSCVSGILVLPGDASVLVSDRCAGLMLRLDREVTPPPTTSP